MGNNLHIISFNIPFPPNYGGVIDVYYKIQALTKAGVKIHLHCFEYGRKNAYELEKICASVNYYKRNTGIISQLSAKPYIVQSRKSDTLVNNLLQNNYPILFEGLHTTSCLSNKLFSDRKLFVRTHNIEHEYYKNLFFNENKISDKLYFLCESIKLKQYEKNLKKAFLFTISPNDFQHFKNKNFLSYYIPAFHPFSDILSFTGKGKYILYHGNLSVNENKQALIFLLRNVFNKISFSVIIAGKDPDIETELLIKEHKHINLIKNPSDEQMQQLIMNAHINLLPTFQATGIKLKLINALFNGRFCIVNNAMIHNTGLENLCSIKNSADEITNEIHRLQQLSFSEKEINKRKEILLNLFSNKKNAETLINLMF